ncbi:hypothetical protein [Paractinoplanes maris]|uniref:hypothetical protein n=1 Tax=Paractinoplanes maris TaxID=1734446 RepID=UPI0020206660|nr:hypothetical protein [Actinoplanes maris]
MVQTITLVAAFAALGLSLWQGSAVARQSREATRQSADVATTEFRPIWATARVLYTPDFAEMVDRELAHLPTVDVRPLTAP